MSVVFPLVVAVDGPAGSGKSSVSKEVARRLGYGFLDTGAAYRALAWHVEASGIDTDDAASVLSCLPSFAYRIGTDPAGYAVHVGDVDVTMAIRDPEISAVVSRVARVPEVRAHLIELFRGIIADELRGAPRYSNVLRGGQQDPHRGIGRHDGRDVAALDDDAGRRLLRDDAPEQLDEVRANLGHSCDPAHDRRDLGVADGRGHIDVADVHGVAGGVGADAVREARQAREHGCRVIRVDA